MRIRQGKNEGVLRYLDRHSPAMPEVRPPREKHFDYWECGAHPDVVERIWDELGKHLPVKCRQVVLGTPALVHPVSGVILAIAFGTRYSLRLPGRIVQGGLDPGAPTKTTWSTGSEMNIRDEIGSDWVFGSWAKDEEAWCLETFREHDNGVEEEML